MGVSVAAALGISTLGDAMLAFALALRSAEMDRPGATVLIFLAEFGPAIVFGSLAGRALDRLDVRPVLIVGFGLQAVLAASIGSVDDLDVQIALLMLMATAGTVAATGAQIVMALIGDFVGRQSADSAVAFATTLATIAAPAVGGALYAATGLGLIAGIDVMTFCLVLAAVAVIVPRFATGSHEATHASRERRPGWPSLLELVTATRDGVQVLRAHRCVGAAMPLVLVVIFATCLEGVAGIYYLHDVAGSDALVYGLMLASWGIGACVGALLTAERLRARPPIVLAGAGLLVGCGLLGAGAVAAPAVVLVAFVAGGVGNGAFNTSVRTLINAGVAASQRGLAWGTFRTLSSGVIALGLILGTPGALLAPRPMVVISGVLAILATAGLARRITARHALPDRRPAVSG